VIVTVCPATVTEAEREDVIPLAAAVSATEPLPLPLAGDTVIHPALDEALQAQPAVVEIVMACVPPPLAIDAVAGETAYVQLPDEVNVKGFDTWLRPVPFGPTAATRDS
jgi:hypothetical protein